MPDVGLEAGQTWNPEACKKLHWWWYVTVLVWYVGQGPGVMHCLLGLTLTMMGFIFCPGFLFYSELLDASETRFVSFIVVGTLMISIVVLAGNCNSNILDAHSQAWITSVSELCVRIMFLCVSTCVRATSTNKHKLLQIQWSCAVMPYAESKDLNASAQIQETVQLLLIQM